MTTELPPPRRAATRADVARMAGVSPAVVSYVLNPGTRPVAAETRARVLDAIEAVSFRPNALARALRTRKTRTLGTLVPDLGNPYYAQLLRYVEDEARAIQHSTLLCNFYDEPAIEAEQLGTLLDRQVDSLIHFSPTSEADHHRALASHTNVVLLDRVTAHSSFHTIGVDYYGGARHAVEHLIEHGHRSIGLITDKRTVASVSERERGWRDALSEAGLVLGPIQQVPASAQGGHDAATELLTSATPPTAVFVVSDQRSVGVLHACHERGVRVPEDLAVASFDGSPEADSAWPPLATVRQPLREIASLAVTMAAEDPRPPRHEVLPTVFTPARSCGCTPS